MDGQEVALVLGGSEGEVEGQEDRDEDVHLGGRRLRFLRFQRWYVDCSRADGILDM